MASVDAAARPRPLRPRPKRGGATRRWHLPGKCARGRKPLLLARGAQTAELSCARRRRQTMGDENSSEMNRRRPFQLDDVHERERRGERGGKREEEESGGYRITVCANHRFLRLRSQPRITCTSRCGRLFDNRPNPPPRRPARSRKRGRLAADSRSPFPPPPPDPLPPLSFHRHRTVDLLVSPSSLRPGFAGTTEAPAAEAQPFAIPTWSKRQRQSPASARFMTECSCMWFPSVDT